MNRLRIWVLAAGFLVVVGGAAAIAVRGLRADDHGWTNVPVTAIGVSPDRKTIEVQVQDYHSRSCNVFRTELRRGDDTWKVRVRVKRVSKYCTTEGCGITTFPVPGPNLPPGVGTLVVPNKLVGVDTLVNPNVPQPTAGPVGSACGSYAIDLHEPVPAGVRFAMG